MMGRGFYGNGACFGAGSLWSGLIMLGVLLFVAAFILWFVKRGSSKDSQLLEDLKTRFVLGEITEEEYLRKKEVLKRR